MTAVATAILPGASAGPRPALASAERVKISVSDFNRTFKAMKKLRPITKAGHGKIAAILPDTTSSTRYVDFDMPYLTEAFKTAGLRDSQFIIQNAQGSDKTQFSAARADIAHGVRVLIVDPLDSGVGARIESYAKRHGVPVIDYDRLTAGGSRRYFVSFDLTAVGRTIGLGLVSCARAWRVKKPKVIVMKGSPGDYHAALLARGYDAVLAPHFRSGQWARVSAPPGTWNPSAALSEFKDQYAAHPDLNAALTPDDAISAPIIRFLRGKGVKARTFPTTGQDATLPGLRNVLIGYQCGTAYKPDYLEAEGAVALALFLRAKLAPPRTLVNGQIKDPRTGTRVPSVLFKPVWVIQNNLKSTVIADQFVTAWALCAGRPYATACKALGITK